MLCILSHVNLAHAHFVDHKVRTLAIFCDSASDLMWIKICPLLNGDVLRELEDRLLSLLIPMECS